jgi:hypothetical protein
MPIVRVFPEEQSVVVSYLIEMLYDFRSSFRLSWNSTAVGTSDYIWSPFGLADSGHFRELLLDHHLDKRIKVINFSHLWFTACAENDASASTLVPNATLRHNVSIFG